MSSAKRPSTPNHDKLPFKQRLVLDSKPKLKNLVAENQYMTCYFDDSDLNKNADIFEKLGFICTHITSTARGNIVKQLTVSLKKNFLIILHYRQKVDGSTIISILNELKRKLPYQSFKNLIPVFVANPTSAKERDLFKMLSRFDIRYAIFLHPGSSCDGKLKTVLENLNRYREKVFGLKDIKPAEKPDLSKSEKEGAARIGEYEKLLEEAEEKMATDPEEAIKIFTRAIEINPDFGSLMKRGDAYYKISEYMAAMDDYRKANTLKKEKADPHAKISACCFSLVRQAARNGDRDMAKQWFNQGMQSFTLAESFMEEIENDDDIFSTEGPRCFYKSMITAMVEADFRDLDMTNEAAIVSGLIEKVFEKTREVDFAKAEINLDAKIDYAILLARTKRYDEAKGIFREVIDQDPEAAGPAYNNFAVELRKNGEHGQAFEAYLEVLRHEVPDRKIVLQNFAKAGRQYAEKLREEFNVDEAITVYKNILAYAENSDGREWILLDLAMAFLERQDQAQAATRLIEAVYINPKVLEMEEFKRKYSDLNNIKQEIIKKFTKGAL